MPLFESSSNKLSADMFPEAQMNPTGLHLKFNFTKFIKKK